MTQKTQNTISADGFDVAVRYAFRVHKEDGEPVRRILDEFDIVDYSCKPFADDVYLYLPLLRYPEKEERLAVRDCLMPLILSLPHPKEKMEYHSWYVKDLSFQVHKKAPTVSDLLGFSVAYEIIGDIAVLDDKIAANESGDEIDVSKVADAILTAHPAVKTVLLSKGPISGEFRTRDLEFIAGIDKTETVHKEYGCKYKVDLGRAYFTPRLSTERHRILAQIEEGDVVIDMFAGVGPYSILIAKSAKPAQVIANDKNDAAVELLNENIALNKVQNITALNEDALFLAEKYASTGDHVIMNLPHNAYDFLDTAVTLCKSGGIIHYYAMTSEDDLFDGSVTLIREAAKKQGREIEVLETRNVRSYAPRQYNICLDVRIL
ncbi:class I SAM-dependent methyltransferase [Methanimicrococcus blatticola]|uniref:Methyltransferase n=1 Tax=Methanimicrococcus blatticola TaxID=91560 RepID=A0A484F7A4_9EURY|nr:class I SAM-dependent methyltransferase family protein [Methanimicrococcus blatticola]MBZ3936233.1 class I SAM-dependent methyltransferase family protein [Methanimicrococcus blatticola]MCC2508237.1 class I SAM-dependent methyltransferase family protein [Methanimicrococcus blatticola]TDQ70308.1 methyltransferase [Methanimicrococcus blatticola]